MEINWGATVRIDEITNRMKPVLTYFPLLILTFYSVCYVTAVLHEVAHAAVAMLLKIPVYSLKIGRGPSWYKSVRLTFNMVPVGGEIALREDVGNNLRISEKNIAYVASAGPLSNLLVAGLAAIAASHFKLPSLIWCGLTFATLYNILCFFQNALPVANTDGFVFWSYWADVYYGEPISQWAQDTSAKFGKVALHAVLGAYMGWMIWSSKLLLPWLQQS